MEIYDNRNTEKYKEFEKLLNNQSSKLKIEEGKIIDGKISKITDKGGLIPLLNQFCQRLRVYATNFIDRTQKKFFLNILDDFFEKI